MEVVAQVKSVRISPRKMRLVADSIRHMSVAGALETLTLLQKRAAKPLEKVMRSAIANAVNNAKMKTDALQIDRIEITEGQALKRFHPSTRGRVHPYKKRSSHVRVVLKEREEKK